MVTPSHSGMEPSRVYVRAVTSAPSESRHCVGICRGQTRTASLPIRAIHGSSSRCCSPGRCEQFFPHRATDMPVRVRLIWRPMTRTGAGIVHVIHGPIFRRQVEQFGQPLAARIGKSFARAHLLEREKQLEDLGREMRECDGAALWAAAHGITTRRAWAACRVPWQVLRARLGRVARGSARRSSCTQAPPGTRGGLSKGQRRPCPTE